MFKINVIQECPHTTTAKGVLHLPHAIIKTFAGAVHDKIEWLALLVGTRSPDGLVVHVKSLRVPLQYRSEAACSLVNEEPLEPDVVGVVHLHPNGMGAFFSATDDNTLNPRFPLSIVIALNSHKSSDVEVMLGFNYQAEGRVQLSCGSIGIIDFKVLPSPVVKEWPETHLAEFRAPNLNTTLHYCPHITRVRDGVKNTCTTKCGIVTTEKAQAIFGWDAVEFLKDVQANTKKQTHYYPQVVDNRRHFGGKKHGNFRSIQEDDDTLLRHWGAYGQD